MYPAGTPTLTTVSVGAISEPLEGRSRPTHFAGVATVVAKLFAIVGRAGPTSARRTGSSSPSSAAWPPTCRFPVEVVGCPTVREPDGLALSSRNVYLTADERAAAPVLHRALLAGAAAVEAGERDPAAVRAAMAAVLVAGRAAGRARLRSPSSTPPPSSPSTRSPASSGCLSPPASGVPDSSTTRG